MKNRPILIISAIVVLIATAATGPVLNPTAYIRGLFSQPSAADARTYLGVASGGAPSGPAGGALAGSYPNPTLAVPGKLLWVSQNGSDTNNGSYPTPFGSIQRAINQLVTNNDNGTFPYSIMVLPGTYNETLDVGFTNLFDLNVVGLGDINNTYVTGIYTTNNAVNSWSLVFKNISFTGNVFVYQSAQRADGFDSFRNDLSFQHCAIFGNAAFVATTFGSFSLGSSVTGTLSWTNVVQPWFEDSSQGSTSDFNLVTDGNLPVGGQSFPFISKSRIGRAVLLSTNYLNNSYFIQAIFDRCRISASGNGNVMIGTNCTLLSHGGNTIRSPISNSGTLTYTPEFYSPAVAGNWPGTAPSSIGAALDSLALNATLNSSGFATNITIQSNLNTTGGRNLTYFKNTGVANWTITTNVDFVLEDTTGNKTLPPAATVKAGHRVIIFCASGVTATVIPNPIPNYINGVTNNITVGSLSKKEFICDGISQWWAY